MRMLLGLTLIATSTLPMLAQVPDADQLKARLQAAETLTSLDAEGVKPWHLKLDAQLFDAKGQPLEQGTIEEWWRSATAYRVEYKFPSYAATDVRNGASRFATEGLSSPPDAVETLLTQVVHPIPSAKDLDHVTPELQSHSAGKVALDCIMLDRVIQAGDERLRKTRVLPLGLFPTYCFDQGKENLRMTALIGSQVIIRNGLGMFQGRQVSTDTTVSEAGVTVATAKVSMLKGGQVFTDDLFAQGALIPTGGGAARIAGGVIAGYLLNHVNPVYPQSAKDAGLSGTVVLRAIIGRDGRVRSLRVMSTPDPDLAIAALSAVHQWRYKPYLLNGQPTEVDTTVTVNFTFR